MIGAGVTDMIAEAVLGRKLETTGHEVLKAVHPHPTMSEAMMEAVADAYDEGDSLLNKLQSIFKSSLLRALLFYYI